MELTIIDGDLLDQDVQVIVNAWNRNIIPWWLLLPQGVSGAIKKRAGHGPFRELGKMGPIPLGGAVETGAGRLPFKAIIHVAGINMLWRSSPRSILDRLLHYGLRAELRPETDFPEQNEDRSMRNDPTARLRIHIPLCADDLVPLSGHPLAFRWTDPRYAQLPASALADIRPLSPAKARFASDALLGLIDRRQQSLSAAQFETVRQMDATGNPAVVRQWLLDRLAANMTEVVVSWQPKLAVVTTALTFCQYWNDFCYPGSDDVTIWSVRDDWAGLYHHTQRIFVGRRHGA